ARWLQVVVSRGGAAEAGLEEDPAVARDHEVGVRRDLPDLEDEAIAVERLAEIEIVDAERGGRLPVAQRHREQAADQLVGRAPALPPVEVGVNAEALPGAELLQVEIEAEIEIAVEADAGRASPRPLRPHPAALRA